MSEWTLIDASGVEKTFSSWGLGKLKRKLTNQAADTVTFSMTGTSYDIDLPFAYADTLKIRRDGVLWFQGRVVKVPRIGKAKSEASSYELDGPWWYLDDLVFQQNWRQLADFSNASSGLTTVARSRVIVGQTIDGEKLDSGAAIREVLAFAIAQGRPLQIGTVEPGVEIPWDELQDPSCAEVIRKILRWMPDAVAYFDYTTTPPTLHIKLRSSLAPVSVTVNAGAPVESLTIGPRYDLQRSVVVLKYEQTSTVDGTDYTRIVKDQYPTTADENAIGALVMTLELSGANASYQRQSITTSPIAENSVDWWKEKLPWLKTLGNIAISGGTRTPDTLDNELVKGTVPSWSGKESGTVVVKAYLSYERLQDSSLDFDASTNPILEQKSDVVLTTRVRATDATSQTFTRLRSFTSGETVPVGLAQALYNSVSSLPYEGELHLKEDECGGVAAVGRSLQLSGGRSEWSAMAAVIQKVEESIDLGETKIKFGPATHLGADDLLGLLRVNRSRRTTYRASERSDGKPSGKAEVDGIDDTPLENASPGVGRTSRLMLLASDGGDGKVILDVSDCNSKELKVREIDICEDGTAKKILVLCSEAYTG
jgi:hypothetical protein